MTESNLNLSQGSDDMPFSSQNIEQALDILSAEAGNLSDAQYQETALANVNLLRGLMRPSGVTPTPMMANLGGSISGDSGIGSAANAAMNVASRVQNLGFVEFTTGLINGTFDAIVGATIKQMEAYAALVADLAKTLSQFQAENVPDAQINAYLSNRYPDGAGGTSIRMDYIFSETAADSVNGIVKKTAQENMRAVIDALILETAGLEDNRLTHVKLGVQDLDTTTPPKPKVDKDKPVYKDHKTLYFETEEILLIRKAIGMILATSMMSHLRAMAREGMARIVITEGEIETKLTFQVSSSDDQKTQQAKYQSDSLNVGARAQAKWGWGSASIGANYSKLNVNMVNASSTASVTTKTEMFGKVIIKFKSETFPPFEAPIVTTPIVTPPIVTKPIVTKPTT